MLFAVSFFVVVAVWSFSKLLLSAITYVPSWVENDRHKTVTRETKRSDRQSMSARHTSNGTTEAL